MKHLFRALGLRALDLVRSYGFPPYTYEGFSPLSNIATKLWKTYSLGHAMKHAIVDPSTTAPGSKMGTRQVVIHRQMYEVRQDRFGRVHLPNAIKHRLFSK